MEVAADWVIYSRSVVRLAPSDSELKDFKLVNEGSVFPLVVLDLRGGMSWTLDILIIIILLDEEVKSALPILDLIFRVNFSNTLDNPVIGDDSPDTIT